MDTSQFRSNALLLSRPKLAARGLRYTASNKNLTTVFKAALLLQGNVVSLVSDLRGYIVEGLAYSEQDRDYAVESLGAVGQHAVILAKALGMKVTGASKRTKLKGTRAHNLFDLLDLANSIVHQQFHYLQGTIESPVPYAAGKRVIKGVEVPYPAGQKPALDRVQQSELDDKLQQDMRVLLGEFLHVYWGLCYDLTGAAPAAVFGTHVHSAAEVFPEVKFDFRTAEERKAARVGQKKTDNFKFKAPKATNPVPVTAAA